MSPTELARFKILNRIAGFKLLINKVTGCWTKAGCNGTNYQKGKFEGAEVLLHVISAILFCNLNPEMGQLSCHKCDIPACCNPSHLYSGTDQDNARDRRYRRVNKIAKSEIINRIETPTMASELDFLPDETKH